MSDQPADMPAQVEDVAYRALDPERLQRLGERATLRPHRSSANDEPGHIIDTAILVLADGHPRSGDDIWTEARRRHLLATTPKKDVYVALVGYIERHSGRGRWPLIIQDIDRRFRLNHPIDDWPDPKHAIRARTAIANAETLRNDLHNTHRGDDASAYELAVCRAFEALGFVVQHIGGNGAPDGVLDAPLGPLAYRTMLECKRAQVHWVLQPDAAEAARYRKPFGAKYSAMVGPAFENGVNLRDELLEHRVSCWTSDDLIQCLENAYDPVEIEALFTPGSCASTSTTYSGSARTEPRSEPRSYAISCARARLAFNCRRARTPPTHPASTRTRHYSSSTAH